LRRSLLVTVTNYLGSTQFYLTITHQRILIVVLTLSLLSLVVGNSVLVWLSTHQSNVHHQAETSRLAHIQSNDEKLKLQESITRSLLPATGMMIETGDFQQLLKIAPMVAASLEQLKTKAQQDQVTIQILEQNLSEVTQSRHDVGQQLLKYTQKSSALEQSLRQLQGLLGEQKESVFDLNLVPKLMQTAQYKLTLLAHIPSAWPMPKPTLVTSWYGPRVHPILGVKRMHKGIDLRCVKGTPILATANGIVTSSRKTTGFGNLVSLTHSYGFSSRYGHLQKRLVKQGEFVYKGQAIGFCGSTGLSNAPHLHYEIRFLAKHSNPRPFLNWNLSNFDGLFKQVPEVQWQSLIKPTQTKSTSELQ